MQAADLGQPTARMREQLGLMPGHGRGVELGQKLQRRRQAGDPVDVRCAGLETKRWDHDRFDLAKLTEAIMLPPP